MWEIFEFLQKVEFFPRVILGKLSLSGCYSGTCVFNIPLGEFCYYPLLSQCSGDKVENWLYFHQTASFEVFKAVLDP
jgi:hypothetical protein